MFFGLWNVTRPPHIALVCILLTAILHFWFPLVQLVFFPLTLFGILLFAAGFLFSIWARNHFKKTGTPLRPVEKPKELQTTGPFLFSRNPMYLGIGLGLLGAAVFLGSLSAFAGPAVFFLVIHFGFIPFEEAFLEKQFGRHYSEYKKKVRRWL